MRLSVLSLLLLIFLLGSGCKSSKSATSGEGETGQPYLKTMLQRRMQQLHRGRDQMSKSRYQKLVERYDDVQFGMNAAYETAARRIAGGYLTKGRKILSKKNSDIRKQIEFFENEGSALYRDLNQELDVLGGPIDFLSITGIIQSVVDVVGKQTKALSCQRAINVYQELYWPSYAELVNTQDRRIDTSFLDASCGKTSSRPSSPSPSSNRNNTPKPPATPKGKGN